MQFAHLFDPGPTYNQMPLRTLLDKRQTFVRYHNDNNEAENFKRELNVAGGPVSNFVVEDTTEQTKSALEDAIFWILKSPEKNAVGPFVVAAGFGFFLLPALWPQLSSGEAVAAAYSSGALTYYLIHSKDLHVKKN